MLEAEESQTAQENAKANLARITEQVARTFGALADERASLEDQITHLEQESIHARSEIRENIRTQYDELRKRPGGIAVVRMRPSHECGACGVGLTSQQAQQVNHGEMPPCPTCGRILVS
jgi:predicted  nucleic acid-binding Zn-ribbon protein